MIYWIPRWPNIIKQMIKAASSYRLVDPTNLDILDDDEDDDEEDSFSSIFGDEILDEFPLVEALTEANRERERGG